MTIKHLAMAGSLLALAACVSPTPFQPAANPGGPGYTDQRLAENRFRVTFSGNSATKRDQVENFLLLRSAEVTRDAGYQWFEFDDRDTKAKTTYFSDFAEYPGWWGPRRHGFYWHSWAYDPFGSPVTTTAITRFEAYAEIVLLTPAEARDNPRAMQASDVIDHLGPAAQPVKPPAS
jgi:hypothetical protein